MHHCKKKDGGFNSSIETKKSISKKTQSLIKSMKKKYSSQQKSPKRILESHQFVQKRIEENQIKIAQFQNSLQDKTLKAKIFNLGTNPQLMESVLFLVKMTICAILLPLTIYLQQHSKGEHSFLNLHQFFINQHSGTIVTILSQSAVEHPVAITFLTEKFIFNPLGKILMKFSLFSGIVQTMKQIKEGKQVLERKLMDVIGRSLFNYETFYAIKYAMESFSLPPPGMSTIEKAKYISKVSGTVLTLFDLILCGTKSSWCQSLQPLQRVTYVFPTFVELGTAVYDIVEGSKHHLGKKQPIEVMSLGFQHYCKKTFKMDNLYLDYSKMSIKDLTQKIVVPKFVGPTYLQKSYEAKFKLYHLMSDPERLMKMAQQNPNFEEELMELKTQSENFEGTKERQQKMSEIKKEVKELVEDLRDPAKAEDVCILSRSMFSIEQDFLRDKLNTDKDNLVAPKKEYFSLKRRTTRSISSLLRNGINLVYIGLTLDQIMKGLHSEKVEKRLTKNKGRILSSDKDEKYKKILDMYSKQIVVDMMNVFNKINNLGGIPNELSELNTENKIFTLRENIRIKEEDVTLSNIAQAALRSSISGIGSNQEQMKHLLLGSVLLASYGYTVRPISNYISKITDNYCDRIDKREKDYIDKMNKYNSEPEKINKEQYNNKVSDVDLKKIKKVSDVKKVLKSSIYFALVSSLAAISEETKDSVNLKELYQLLSDKHLTTKQQQEIQELIDKLKKKSKRKSLKKRIKMSK